MQPCPFVSALCSCICSCATAAEWSAHVKYYMTFKPKVFTTLPSKKKFADPWIKENKWKNYAEVTRKDMEEKKNIHPETEATLATKFKINVTENNQVNRQEEPT